MKTSYEANQANMVHASTREASFCWSSAKMNVLTEEMCVEYIIFLMKYVFVPPKFCSFSISWLPQMLQNVDRMFC
jgi:hypothetical protein